MDQRLTIPAPSCATDGDRKRMGPRLQERKTGPSNHEAQVMPKVAALAASMLHKIRESVSHNNMRMHYSHRIT